MTSAESIRESCTCFPRAIRYEQVRSTLLQQCGEARSMPWPSCSERHIQCIWYDPALRPGRLRTTDGEWITIENPGTWNLEAGPDFLGAALLVNEQRRICGDVEIHLHPSDWKHHGHQADPRYQRVRIHVFYYPGLYDRTAFPPGTLHVQLKNNHGGLPEFAFETIDLTAYPYSVRGVSPPCRKALHDIPVDQCERLLDAAGEERLRRKALRLRHAIERTSPAVTLYAELFYALGFKHNSTPFRELATLVPEDRLREQAAGNELAAYAILAGVSGLLPADVRRTWNEEARRFVRTSWEHWFRLQDVWPERLDKTAWNLAGSRPLNHPLRRLMAAARLFTGERPFYELLLETLDPCGRPDIAAMNKLLERPGSTYWDQYEALGSAGPPAARRLIGPGRAAAMVTNVLLPFLVASIPMGSLSQTMLDHLPREPDNALVRQMVHTLFGPDCPSILYRSTLRKQGLLLLFNDFCLTDRSLCADCLLPELAHRL